MTDRRQSIACRKAATRPPLMISAAMPMIGTTGSAPTMGTSTSGMRKPVPSPAIPPPGLAADDGHRHERQKQAGAVAGDTPHHRREQRGTRDERELHEREMRQRSGQWAGLRSAGEISTEKRSHQMTTLGDLPRSTPAGIAERWLPLKARRAPRSTYIASFTSPESRMPVFGTSSTRNAGPGPTSKSGSRNTVFSYMLTPPLP